jgi:cob(I)alamin adenosyltransferase
LLGKKQLQALLEARSPKTSLCLTGRNFPKDMLKYVDIATSMTKVKHHFDDKFLATKGIDF